MAGDEEVSLQTFKKIKIKELTSNIQININLDRKISKSSIHLFMRLCPLMFLMVLLAVIAGTLATLVLYSVSVYQFHHYLN